MSTEAPRVELINLTPHPIHVYPASTPDRIEPDGDHEPLYVLKPSGTIARLGVHEVDHIAMYYPDGDLRVSYIDYGGVVGLPALDEDAWDDDDDRPRVHYVVSLVVALASRGRSDLLSPYLEIRTMSGQVIGCRAFARPV